MRKTIILMCMFVNYILVLGFLKKEKQFNNMNETNNKRSSFLSKLTTIISIVITVFFVLRLILYINNLFFRMFFSIASFLSVIYGNTNKFKDFEFIKNIIISKPQKSISLDVLFFYNLLFGMTFVFFECIFSGFLAMLDYESKKAQLIGLGYNIGINYICISVGVCTLIELFYFINKSNKIKNLYIGIEDFPKMMAKQLQHNEFDNELNKKCMAYRALLYFDFFMIDVLGKVFINCYLILLNGINIMGRTLQAGLRSLMGMLCVEIKNEYEQIGTVKSVRLIINWSIVVALTITYIDIIRDGIYSLEITEVYSFVVGIIAIPMIISMIIDTNKDVND